MPSNANSVTASSAPSLTTRRTIVHVNACANAERNRANNRPTNCRIAATVSASIAGIHPNDAPHVTHAIANAYAISAAANPNVATTCNLVYSIWVPASKANPPTTPIAATNDSTE
jgi:hypothetical protein